MVALARKAVALPLQRQRPILSDSIGLSEVLDAGMRFEASTFNIAARAARNKLSSSGHGLLPLHGNGGMAFEAHNAFRFRRIFVKPENGIPFLPSSEINSIRPRIERWLSRKLTKRLEDLIVRNYDVLISCSGSIGNIGLAGRRMAGLALSQDAIRVRIADEEVAGFVAAFLRTSYGRLQLQSVTYGSVIAHIEPEHLARVYVPSFHSRVQKQLGRVFLEATSKRDQANDLIDVAIAGIDRATGLPSFSAIENESRRLTNSICLAKLDGRFEGSFHDPAALALLSHLQNSSLKTIRLADSQLVKEIRPITKFRKRTYVEKGGIPLLSSKQLFQVDPIGIKRLAKGAHTKNLPEIALEPCMLAITCSGTIGRVQIIPKYMQDWTANQHSIRIVPVDEVKAGLLFAWLSSSYGQILIRRHSYGSVVPEIDKSMLGDVLVPMLRPSVEQEIANLVMRANQLRDEAWCAEEGVKEEIEARIGRKAA